MSDKNLYELTDLLVKSEQELGNIITKDIAENQILEVINLIGEENFKRFLRLNWEEKDLVLRVLEFLNKY
jgi:hypothetical protein